MRPKKKKKEKRKKEEKRRKKKKEKRKKKKEKRKKKKETNPYTYIQELTGTFVGTALQTGWQRMFTGAGALVNKKSIAHLESLGLLTASYGRNGRVISTQWKEGWKDLYQNNPVEFIKEINKVYKKHGIPESKYGETYGEDFPNTTSRVFNAINKR